MRANPILEGCVESLGRVLKELNEADEGWWRDGADVRKQKGKKAEKKGKKGGKRKRGGSISNTAASGTASVHKSSSSKKKKRMLELSDVYYPEGGASMNGSGSANDTYDYRW